MARSKKPFDEVAAIKAMFSYDPETGAIYRIARQTRSRTIIPLDEPVRCESRNGNYIRVSIYGKSIYGHRIAWLFTYGEWPEVIDHINGDGTDNRIANLRNCQHSDNAQNRHTSPAIRKGNLPGVCTVKSTGKYFSQIQTGRKIKYLGQFDTPEEAHNAYISAKRELHSFSTI